MLYSRLLFCLFAFAGASVSAQDLPRRIVSMNLCTDELLLMLVNKSRIASVSYFAADADYSSLANLAEDIPLNRGQADEVITYDPDLVLTSQFSATLAANMLERMGYNVHRLGFAATVEDIYEQITEIAGFTGAVSKGENLIANIKTDIAQQQQVLLQQLQGKSAVFFSSNGFTFGSASLQDSFIRSLGMRNIAADAGITGPALLSLEVLLAAEPDYIFVDQSRALDAQLAHPMLQHPAFARLVERTRKITLVDTYFQCAGPRFALAYAAFAEQLRDAN